MLRAGGFKLWRSSYHSVLYTHLSSSSTSRRVSLMATTEGSLSKEIEEQSALVTKLKAESAESTVYEEARKRLAELKKNLNLLRNAAGGGKGSEKKKERLLLKTAKVSC